MPTPRTRASRVPAVTLSVGDVEPSEDRNVLAERRRTSPSLHPPAFVASDADRAPFAWLLACGDARDDVLIGPDWAW